MDSTRLDTLYNECAIGMSASYRKTVLFMDAGKTDEAAKEFKTNFLTEIKRFYGEASETAPKRYLGDCNWNEKIKKLYVLTRETSGFLDRGDVKNSNAGLESLREFFYKLNTDNKIYLAGDAIYAFRKELNRYASKNSLTKEELAALNALKAKIFMADSSKIKAGKEQFAADAKAWAENADKILSLPRADAKQTNRLKEITEVLYLKYGMDLE